LHRYAGGASPYDAPPTEYVCEPALLTRNNTCTVAGHDSSVVARPHPINDTRALAPDKWRRVVNADGRGWHSLPGVSDCLHGPYRLTSIDRCFDHAPC
jgi:hypothetical protein